MKSILCFFATLFPFILGAQNIQPVAVNNNQFAFKLFRQELGGNKGENLFLSPFSISTAMAMVYAGARNETALQMSQTMNFARGEHFHNDFRQLLTALNHGVEGPIELNIANGLWAQQGYNFLDSYFNVVKTEYKSELKNVDFTADISREATRKEINSWVAQETHDKIQDILGRGDLSQSTKLVLVNAIYFYGDWDSPFEKQATKPKPFYLHEGNPLTVPFMNKGGRYAYFEDSTLQAIEIPYKDNKVSMVIFLPAKSFAMTGFEKTFDVAEYGKIMGSMKTEEVTISLPKFQTTCKLSLSQDLTEMGMPLAFSGSADFSGMTGKRDLCISDVIHQAFIRVDEQGTEAAAATAVIMKMMAVRNPAEPKYFNADHPFLFLIRDNATGSILFMGKIAKPGLLVP